jgi:hypothetical protein
MANSQKKGFLLPPAVGYSLSVLIYLFSNYKVSLRFLIRTILTVLINLINWPFRSYEKIFINKKYSRAKIENAPVFIVGHWRSGTTHLHNILCQDPQMSYTTTYQSVFPDTLFNIAGRFLFEGFARILIPGTRKGDNVTLGTGLPQEEEFALGDKTPFSFYYFWMFPRSLKKFYEQFIRFKGVDQSREESWKKDYKLLISKALKNTGGQVFLSKNPPNTGRIEKLLEMFPEARFIHIHRNPVEVYLSTRNFFLKMLPHLQLQTIDQKELDDCIFELYKDIMNDYLEQRALIPEKQLVEIAFDTLEADPKTCIRNLYQSLDLSGYKESEPHFDAYLDRMKSYKKNKHYITESLIKKIQREWGFAMEEWGYSIPEHIEIEQDA